jgi:hypothetical protein
MANNFPCNPLTPLATSWRPTFAGELKAGTLLQLCGPRWASFQPATLRQISKSLVKPAAALAGRFREVRPKAAKVPGCDVVEDCGGRWPAPRDAPLQQPDVGSALNLRMPHLTHVKPRITFNRRQRTHQRNVQVSMPCRESAASNAALKCDFPLPTSADRCRGARNIFDFCVRQWPNSGVNLRVVGCSAAAPLLADSARRGPGSYRSRPWRASLIK